MSPPNAPLPYPGAPSPVLPATSSAALTNGDEGRPPEIRGPPGVAGDILIGAAAIAQFLFGDAPGARRQVYRLSSEVAPQFRLPTFKLGSNTLCARKSTLLKWIEEMETARAGVAA